MNEKEVIIGGNEGTPVTFAAGVDLKVTLLARRAVQHRRYGTTAGNN